MSIESRIGINRSEIRGEIHNTKMEEVVFDGQHTLEQELLRKTDLRALDFIPENDFTVVKNILLVDSQELSLDKKRALFITRIWAHSPSEEGLNLLKKYFDAGMPNVISAIDFIAENQELESTYDRLDQFEDLLQKRNNIRSFKHGLEIVKEMMLQGKSEDEIKLALARNRNQSSLRIEIEPQKRESLMAREGWVKIKNLRKEGMSNMQIAQKTGMSIREVNVITSHLILIGEIKPHAKGKTKARSFSSFCARLLYLRSLGMESPTELAKFMEESLPRVKQAIGKLIALDLIEPIPHQQTADLRHKSSKEKKKKILGLRLNSDMTVDEIASELKLGREQVRNEISRLKKAGLLINKKEQQKKIKKEKLRALLRRIHSLDPNRRVSIYSYMKVLRADDDTLFRLYYEIAEEEPVPQLISGSNFR